MNVMLVDDDRESLDSLGSALRLEGFRVKEFLSPGQALQEYDPQAIDVVITDYHLAGMSGIDLLEKIHLLNIQAPVMIISGDPDPVALAKLSNQAGACAFFSKPLKIRDVISKIKKLAKFHP